MHKRKLLQNEKIQPNPQKYTSSVKGKQCLMDIQSET